MAYTLADHKRRFAKSTTGYYTLTLDDMPNAGKYAMQAVSVLPNKMRDVVIKGWLKIANGVPAYGLYMHDIERADAWVRQLVQPFLDNPLPLDLNASDDDIITLAKNTAEKFEHGMTRFGWDENRVRQKAAAMGVDWGTQFTKQIENGWDGAILARLCDPKWWKRHFNRALCRRLEHVYRAHCNLVHKRKWLYVSDDTLMRRRQQKARNAATMQAVLLVNELGQEFQLSELVEKSNANPAIRRAELMVRIAGFETIAQDLGHCGEFITLTCPSRFHRAHHLSGSENSKYDGSTPREANAYLNKVWGRIQAALKREDITIYGFRVVEPHHDGCPHWHGLFFMDKDHSKRFRQIVARYACREDREELGLTYFETDTERRQRAREIQAEQLARDEKAQSINTISGSLKLEADFWKQADWRVFQGVGARVDFKAINWKKGTAAGYIAKYIAKNIDGKNNYGESVGDDYEADGTMSAIDTAERVDAWASLWGIRQFQQIGGAPVTVWRELRREFHDNTFDDSDIIVAARAADLGDWGKFTQVMGGVSVKRSERPVQLYKELPMYNGEVWKNRYGEPMDKAIRGVLDLSTGEIRFTRIHEWELVSKNGAIAPAWTCVNNSTNLPETDIFVKKRKETPIDYDYFKAKISGSLTPEYRATMKAMAADANEMLDGYAPASMTAFVKAERDLAVAELAKIRIFEETSLLPNGKTVEEQAHINFERHTRSQKMSQQAQKEYAVQAEIAKQTREQRDYLAMLDTLLPPVWTLTPQYQSEQQQQAELRQQYQQYKQPEPRPRKFNAPKQYDTLASLTAETNKLLAQIDQQIDALWDWDFKNLNF